jgi:NADH-quinone oxidoreductase subunit J
MGLTQIMFYFLSLLAVGSALMVVYSKNPVYSILFLIATFFAISGHYILMNAQFLGVVNIIVYAGAIMVLFLFVVMLMNLNRQTEPQRNIWVSLAAVVAGGALLLVVVVAAKDVTANSKALEVSGGTIGLIKDLGRALFKEYVIPFEISSVLFLSAMVGAVILARKETPEHE